MPLLADIRQSPIEKRLLLRSYQIVIIELLKTSISSFTLASILLVRYEVVLFFWRHTKTKLKLKKELETVL